MHAATETLALEQPRRSFTAAEIARMVEAGILEEDERIELIEGALIEMAAKSVAHDMLKFRLTRYLAGATDPALMVAVEGTLELSERVLVEPDIAIFPEAAARTDGRFIQVKGPSILLLIEIAASSLAYDLGPKAALYAHHGVREYWVVDTNERIVWVYAKRGGEGWSPPVRRGSGVLLTPEARELGRVSFRLSDFG